MNRYAVSLAVALAMSLGGRAAADELTIGNPAPKLEVKEFVKGEPVKELARGKVHVVEFWATWCGPCIAAMPHLTELQKKHKDVIFIGVSIWERDPSGVKPFVEKQGEKMDYRVAMDDVAAGADANTGKMAKSWMAAAGRGGIPSTFIVNAEGTIAWIGHPMGMDKPLDEIVAGKWDIAKAAADYKKEQAAQAKMRAMYAKIQKLQVDKDMKGLLALVDEAIKDEPGVETALATVKLEALVKVGDAEKAIEYGNRVVDELYKDSAGGLNNVAWMIVEKPGENPNRKLMQLGLRAAQRADELAKGKDGAIADTVAKAYFETGDAAKALEHQERAVKLAVGTPLEQDPGLKSRLEQYRKATKP
jgi:thiol-disulfide isomerase/thioredoxin